MGQHKVIEDKNESEFHMTEQGKIKEKKKAKHLKRHLDYKHRKNSTDAPDNAENNTQHDVHIPDLNRSEYFGYENVRCDICFKEVLKKSLKLHISREHQGNPDNINHN